MLEDSQYILYLHLIDQMILSFLRERVVYIEYYVMYCKAVKDAISNAYNIRFS